MSHKSEKDKKHKEKKHKDKKHETKRGKSEKSKVDQKAEKQKQKALKEERKRAEQASLKAKPKAAKPFDAPQIPYLPADPQMVRPSIGLIACGGITWHHLNAYKQAGYNVVALCDLIEQKAINRRDEFYPDAEVTIDYHDILARDDIDVVDIATHPPERLKIIEDALNAKKHVLSQKPFVLNLDDGERLASLAEERGVKFAVNQNGRWAPHFSYLRHAIAENLIGDITSVHTAVHWDHNWIAGLEFEKIRHVILYDFSIHWFDILTCFMGERTPQRVYASFTRSGHQVAKPALLAQAVVEYEGAQSSLIFDGDVQYGQLDRTMVTGSKGTLTSIGDDLGTQRVTLYNNEGWAKPKLKGAWFSDGFHGTMGELLCAIEENREPYNSARNNLKSLALCFAAIASAEDHVPKTPGEIRQVPLKGVDD